MESKKDRMAWGIFRTHGEMPVLGNLVEQPVIFDLPKRTTLAAIEASTTSKLNSGCGTKQQGTQIIAANLSCCVAHDPVR